MHALTMLLALLFAVSVTMLMASVFTARTAFFFREKTKAKGAWLWSFVLLATLGLGVLVPPEDDAPAVQPAYTVSVAEKVAGEKLVLNCPLPSPVDAAALRALAATVYAGNGGTEYKRVVILWHLPGRAGEAWAKTEFTGGAIDVPESSGSPAR